MKVSIKNIFGNRKSNCQCFVVVMFFNLEGFVSGFKKFGDSYLVMFQLPRCSLFFSFLILSFHCHACDFMVTRWLQQLQAGGKRRDKKCMPVESACFYQENQRFPASPSLKSGVFICSCVQCINLIYLPFSNLASSMLIQ